MSWHLLFGYHQQASKQPKQAKARFPSNSSRCLLPGENHVDVQKCYPATVDFLRVNHGCEMDVIESVDSAVWTHGHDAGGF